MILKILNKLLVLKWFPISLRIMTFGVFVILVVIGLSSTTDNLALFNPLYKTNLTTCFVWRLWWPMVVLSAVIFGRIWCIICPVEMITTFFAKIGLKKKRPRWILSGWVIPVFFIIILAVGITFLQIDRNPKYTSAYLLTIMGIAIISGLIFEKNTFCRYICPIGYLLGVFSKMAIWGWRVKNKSICISCSDKSCIRSKYTYDFNNKSCGVDLIPANIDDNNFCLLCGGCMRTCKIDNTTNILSRPNPAIVKIGFANDLMKFHPIRLVEWVFIFFVTGSMISELIHFKIVSAINDTFFSGTILFSFDNKNKLIDVLFLYFVLPFILWILPYLVTLFSKVRISFSNYIHNIGFIFIPIIAFFYVGLVFMEIVKKFPYYGYIVHDVKGIRTMEAIISKQIEIPKMPIWTEWGFSVIQILALIVGIFISFKVIRQLILKVNVQIDTRLLYILPIIFSFVIYIEAVIYEVFLNNSLLRN